jgi:hypothetical protein
MKRKVIQPGEVVNAMESSAQECLAEILDEWLPQMSHGQLRSFITEYVSYPIPTGRLVQDDIVNQALVAGRALQDAKLGLALEAVVSNLEEYENLKNGNNAEVQEE